MDLDPRDGEAMRFTIHVRRHRGEGGVVSGRLAIEDGQPLARELPGEKTPRLGLHGLLLGCRGEIQAPLPSPERFIDLQYLKAAGIQ